MVGVFGAPATHEDDPERALRAALAMRDWALDDASIELRIAINTGEALVALGAIADGGDLAVSGEVINTIASLQASASRNRIWSVRRRSLRPSAASPTGPSTQWWCAAGRHPLPFGN